MHARDTLSARFEAQARSRPEAPALVSGDAVISYGRLAELSGALAARIAASPPTGNGVAAILSERGARLVVAMLACARAGRTFVVFDLAYPAARLHALAEVCRPDLLLLAAAHAPDGLDLRLPVLPVALDAPAAPWEAPDVPPDAPAYLLFTSGSTGAPKCVFCSHAPLVNFVAWQARTFDLTHEDRFTLLSGLSHDPVLRDVFTPLSLGASLHIPDQALLTAPGGLHDWFVAARPTVAHMTPPLAGTARPPRRGKRARS